MKVVMKRFLSLFLFIPIMYASEPIWFSPQVTLDSIKRELDNKSSKVDARNSIGQTGLMYAINMSNFGTFGNANATKGLVEMLVQHGADVNARSLQSPREEDHSFNNTPLHYVAIQPNYRETISLLNYLIDAGADVNVKNSLGETPLMWTANLQLLEDKPGITKEFIADLADVNLQNNIGDTYLHVLIKNKDYMWIQKFIDMFGSMIDTSIKNVEGWTVLDTAKKTLQPESTRALEGLKVIGLKDDIKTTDILGRTGLGLAIIRNDLPFARRQIEKGSQVNAKDKTRFANTPLHFAVTRHAHMEPFVALLIANRADVNFKNSYGDTPLHYLVKFNLTSPERDKVARMLINAGADPLIKNNRGKTSIDLAKIKNPSFSNDLSKWHKEHLAHKEKSSEAEL
jgi:ankyrin repeat protein